MFTSSKAQEEEVLSCDSEAETDARKLLALGERIKWELCLNSVDECPSGAHVATDGENGLAVERFVLALFQAVKFVRDICAHLSRQLSAVNKDAKYQHGVYVNLLKALYTIYELDVIALKKSEAFVRVIQAYRAFDKLPGTKGWTSSSSPHTTHLRSDLSSGRRSRVKLGIGAARNGVSNVQQEQQATSPRLTHSNTTPPPQSPPPPLPQQQQEPSSEERPKWTSSKSPNFQHTKDSQSASQLGPFLSAGRERTAFLGQQNPRSNPTTPRPMSSALPQQCADRTPQQRQTSPESEGISELDNLTEWYSAKYPGLCYARLLFPKQSFLLSGFITFCMNALGDRVVNLSDGYRTQLLYVRGLTFGFFYLFTADCSQEREDVGLVRDQNGSLLHMQPSSLAQSLWERAEPWIAAMPFTPVCEGRYYECTTALFDDIPSMSHLALNTNTVVTRFKASLSQISAEAVLPGTSDFNSFFSNITLIAQDISVGLQKKSQSTYHATLSFFFPFPI